jgi:hypothetical protein
MATMTDIAQTNLREPAKVDWENYNAGGSSYMAPPPSLDDNGKAIVYRGVTTPKVDGADRDGYLQFLLDPIKISQGDHKGYEIRFTRASVAPFTKPNAEGVREPIKGNPNQAANFLRSCGLQVKPQTNSEYIASATRAAGKEFSFTTDWEAYNKDTGERVKGFLAFPLDDQRPGMRKTILKKGDLYNVVDSKGKPTGEQKVVESEVLFANARLKFFQDPTRQRG